MDIITVLKKKMGFFYMKKENFHTLSRLTRNTAIWPLVILCSPTEDSKLKSISGMDVKASHSWSEGGGFICNRNVPRRDVTLMVKERGTFGEKQSVRWRKMKSLLSVCMCTCLWYIEEEKGLEWWWGREAGWNASQEKT